MLRNITKPRPWNGGAQVIEDEFGGAQLRKRVEVNRQEWKDHCQIDTAEHFMEKQAVEE